MLVAQRERTGKLTFRPGGNIMRVVNLNSARLPVSQVHESRAFNVVPL